MAAGTKSSDAVRHMRLCEACGGVDDHPRHTASTRTGESGVVSADVVRKAIAAGLGDAGVAEALDSSTTVLHMDCCAQRGCETCRQVLASAGGAKGTKLLSHIQSGAVDHLSSASAADVIRDQGRDTDGETVTVVDEAKARQALGGDVGFAIAHPESAGQAASGAASTDSQEG